MGPVQYTYRIVENSSGETLAEGRDCAENLNKIFPSEIHGFLKKEIERKRLTDTSIKMADITYEIRPIGRHPATADVPDPSDRQVKAKP